MCFDGQVKEWFWKFDVQYSLFLYSGTNVEEPIVLQGRVATTELKTPTDSAPRQKTLIREPIEVSLAWLATQLQGKAINFKIDRTQTTCRTPRRNEAVEAALTQLKLIASFAQRVGQYFEGGLFPLQSVALDLKALNSEGIFVPVLALFEEPEPHLPPSLLPPLLVEQKRALAEKLEELKVAFAKPAGLVSLAEAYLVTLVKHLNEVCAYYVQGVDYIESMLYRQLVAAIGKEVQPVDFTNFMNFWARKLFRPEFQPRPFSYAVRRPDHTPEGTVTLEAQLADGSLAQPLQTMVASEHARYPMQFCLDAATLVPFWGERYVHGAILSQFDGVAAASYRLVARARQFSIFALLIGKLSGPTTFEPQGALLIQNKDDLRIPLFLEQIPSPKEFRDAIESMSPEQQRFCKMYRSMQLSHSLFGLVVLQVKPQLEKLLNLPVDALTKEIRLTQKLLDLLQTYQIPSDLLSYDGPQDAEPPVKVALVAQYVKRMYDVIESTKAKELKQAQMEAQFRLAIDQGPPAVPMPSPAFSAFSMGEGAAFGGGGGGGSGLLGGLAFLSAPPSGGAAPSGSAAPPVPATPAPDAEPARPEGKAGPQEETDELPKGCIDMTSLPSSLDRQFSALDTDHSLHAVIIDAGTSWQKNSRKYLLSDPVESTLGEEEQRKERNKAFDLIDSLSKSGALPFDDAELHVMVANNHCFAKSLVNTIVQDNVNPIEKVERSLLIVASALHQQPVEALVKPEQVDRLRELNPQLF